MTFGKAKLFSKFTFGKVDYLLYCILEKRLSLSLTKTGDCGKIFPEFVGNKNRQIVELFSGIKSFVLPKFGIYL